MSKTKKNRQQHKQEKAKKECQNEIVKDKEYLKMKIPYFLLIIIFTCIILIFTVLTENPLWLIAEWCIIYNSLCLRWTNDLKKFKKLKFVPVLELSISIIFILVLIYRKKSYVISDMIFFTIIVCGLCSAFIYFMHWRNQKKGIVKNKL